MRKKLMKMSVQNSQRKTSFNPIRLLLINTLDSTLFNGVEGEFFK